MTVIAGVPRFVLDCPISKQDFAMEVGLRWDSSAHHWYTTDVRIAARLRNFAEGPLRDRLNVLAAQSAIKPTLSFERGLYVFRADRELAEVARNAEFFRDPDTEHWYTTDAHYAMRLSQYGDENCHAQIRASIAAMEEMLTASRALDADIEIPAPPGRHYFPHQRAAVAYVNRAWRTSEPSLNGDAVPGVLIGDEMRVGKTGAAIGVINLAGEAFKKILVVCPAGVKLGWYRELQAWLTTKRKILIADSATSAWKFEAADISIVNFDILKDHAEWERRPSRDKRAVLKSPGRLDQPWDLVIVDECFPFDTKVETELGPMTIGEIVDSKLQLRVVSRNLATGAADLRDVVRWVKRPATEQLLTVHHDGGKFTCTSNHKIWTEEDGFTQAGLLKDHHHLCLLRTAGGSAKSGQEHGQIMQQKLHRQRCEREAGSAEEAGRACSRARERTDNENVRMVQRRIQGRGFNRRPRPTLLRRLLCVQMANDPARTTGDVPESHKGRPASLDPSQADAGRARIGAYEEKQSYEQPRGQAANDRIAQGAAILGQARGERRAYSTATAACGDSGATHGVRYTHGSPAQSIRRDSFGLQGRLSARREQDRDRAGRHESQHVGEPSARSEEDGCFRNSRVVRVEIQERSSSVESRGRSGPDQFVYNLEVAEHHNYIADGVLVSNCHVLKNPQALRSIVGYALLERARRKLCLTGTPITSWIEDLYPLLHALDPISWPTLNRFKARYGSGRDARNLDELKRKLRSSILCRRLLREVQKNLPPKVREVLEFSVEDAAAMRAVQREAAAWERQQERLIALQAAAELAKASDDARTHTEASRLLGEGKRIAFNETAKLRHETALVKVPYVVDHIKTLVEDPAYKVVVGAWHTDVIEKLAASFGNRAVTVTGAVSADLKVVAGRETSDRMQRVDRFLEDPTCQVFFGNLVAAGMGLNLSSASHIICAELWYVPWVMQQFEARCEHPTKVTSIFVQHLVLAGSIDARIARALVEKQALIDQALDGASQAEDLSVVDEPATKSLTRAAIEREADGMAVTEIAAIHRALKELSGMNQVDSAIARALAGYSVLSAKQAVLGRNLIDRYSDDKKD